MLLRGPTFADRLGASSKRGGVNGVGTPHPDPPLPLIRLRRFARPRHLLPQGEKEFLLTAFLLLCL